ncbi:hypothetical protein AU375_00275 [Methylobacterium radiotolerans]|nr:hypothetical protein AU375_00275 [Methylobacterium radiotolerans]
MFSYFGNRTQGMAFCNEKNEHARRSAALHAETVLFAYLNGKEKEYAVRDAMREVEALFREGAALAVSLVNRALATDPDDYEARFALLTRAVEMLDRQVRGDTADMLRPGRL